MRLGTKAAALLGLTLLSGAGVPSSPAGAGGSVVSQEVQERLGRDGRARVIVELRLSGGAHVPEGQLTSGAAVSAHRSDIGSARSSLLGRLQGRGHRLLRQYETVPYVALEVAPDAVAELEASSLYVQRVVEDTLNAPSLPRSVPLIQGDQAWTAGHDGAGIMVAILDTGVDKAHPFLAGKVLGEACYSSTVSGRSITLCPDRQEEQTGPGAGVRDDRGPAPGRGPEPRGARREPQGSGVSAFRH
jgi:subtilisin family serine protease